MNKKYKQLLLQSKSTNNSSTLIHPIIETHCHLDYFDTEELEFIIKQCLELGIEKLITISVDSSNLQLVVDYSNQYDHIFGSQGIHPHKASEWNTDIKEIITRNLTNNKKLVAVGEAGLDYHYNYSPRKEQINAFEQQLQIASDLNLPIVIHSRDAEDDTISILKNFSSKLKRKGVIHSFSSKKKLADFALDDGFHLGFNGIISFKSASELREIVKITPIEQIILETDSPYLTPSPFRGTKNSPAFLPFIADIISEEKQIPIKSMLETIYNNTISLFKLPT